jgi:hypothetical protein
MAVGNTFYWLIWKKDRITALIAFPEFGENVKY